MPSAPSPPFVARNDDHFADWVKGGRPRPALLKLHGSLDGPDRFDQPVVETEPELAQLSADRLTALQELGGCDDVLVTGYAGADIDVYQPLLGHLPRGRFTWACPHYNRAPHVPDEVRLRGGLVAPPGDDGTAVPNLRARLGLDLVYPNWSKTPRDPRPTKAFEAWLSWLETHPELAAQAYAWMLLDADRYGESIDLLVALGAERRADDATLHLAEALALRQEGSDRSTARRLFARVVRRAPFRTGRKTLALTRIAETFRNDPSGRFHLRPAFGAFLALVARLLGAIDDPGGAQGARADSALGHYALRFVEVMLARLRNRYWLIRSLLTTICRIGLFFQQRALAPSQGNRQTFVRQQTIELNTLMRILHRQNADPNAGRDLEQLRESYWAANDQRGMANTTAALALVALANCEPTKADALLTQALDLYHVDGRTDPSGAALVERRRRFPHMSHRALARNRRGSYSRFRWFRGRVRRHRWEGEMAEGAPDTDGSAAERIVYCLCALLIVGLAIACVFGAAQSNGRWSVAAAGVAIALASALVGALLGLLFGIPRLVAQSTAPANDPTAPSGTTAGVQPGGYTSNTNFEEVSDWLTKILLGAGLTQLGQVPGRLGDLGDYLAPSLGGTASAAPLAVGLVVFNVVAGFIVLYLSARLWLGRAFSEADRLARKAAALTIEIKALPPAADRGTGNLPEPEDLTKQDKEAALDIYKNLTSLEAAATKPVFDEDAYRRVAQQLVKAELYDQAVSTLDLAFSKYPDAELLVFAGAICAVHKSDYDNAERFYFRALAAKPGYADAFYNLACNEVRRLQPERAGGYLQQAFALRPDLREYARTDSVWDEYRGRPPLGDLLPPAAAPPDPEASPT
jgi:hypothetical protein